MRATLFAILLTINAQAQFGRGSEWHKDNMSDKAKLQYSRAWKIAGLTMVSTGIYLAQMRQNPQRVDVPLIGFGTIIMIEGIRLRKLVKR